MQTNIHIPFSLSSKTVSHCD